jgi:hypothetical protein
MYGKSLAHRECKQQPASFPNRQIQTFQDAAQQFTTSSTPLCLLRHSCASIPSIDAKTLEIKARQGERRELWSTTKAHPPKTDALLPKLRSMTTIVRTRVPLETLSMSQPTARRRSKRLAGEISRIRVMSAQRTLRFFRADEYGSI